ncbi:MAG: four helix bundle protein [Acidobacteria bacterium]|nr:four helix bundle protein [Acidobacteriota bacterium]
MSLVTAVYSATENFPQREVYGLTQQLRRAAVSVPSNIAEGKARLSMKEFVQFLSKARGSLAELATQLEIAKNLGYLMETTYNSLAEQAAECGRVLNGLIDGVQRQINIPATSD